MVKSRYIGDGHPTFNRNPYIGYINPYYWVDVSHPLLYGNNGSLDPIAHIVDLSTPSPPKKHTFHQLSHEKNHPTFQYTGLLIGILMMVYYSPYITG